MSNVKQKPSLPKQEIKQVRRDGRNSAEIPISKNEVKRNSMIPRQPLHKDPKVRQPKSNNIQKGQKNPSIPQNSSSVKPPSKQPPSKKSNHSIPKDNVPQVVPRKKVRFDPPNGKDQILKIPKKQSSKIDTIESESDLSREHHDYCGILREICSLTHQNSSLKKEKTDIEKSLCDYQKCVISLYTQIAHAITNVEYLKDIQQQCSNKIKSLNCDERTNNLYEEAQQKCIRILDAKHLNPKEKSKLIHYDINRDINQFLIPIPPTITPSQPIQNNDYNSMFETISIEDLVHLDSGFINPESDLLSKSFKPTQKYSKYIL
jgi:hypothetical protein